MSGDSAVLHFNARVHGMKSALFDRAQLESMLDGDLARFTDALLDSPYKEELAEALTRHEGVEAVEEAVARSLVHSFQRLAKGATGEMKFPVKLFLARWDLFAVKSLLRCKHHAVPADEARAWLLPGPSLGMPVLLELAALDSMEQLVNSLVAWNRKMCKGLAGALPEYQERRDLAALEEALDRAYFASSVKRLSFEGSEISAELRDLLKAEIDRINLRVLFQILVFKGDRDLALERMMAGGFVPRDTLQEMLHAGTPDGAMEKLGTTRYKHVAGELLVHMKAGRLTTIERYFERIIIKEVKRLALRNVFGIGTVMYYVWLKHIEIVNLRLIARGLAGHLSRTAAEEEMFFA